MITFTGAAMAPVFLFLNYVKILKWVNSATILNIKNQSFWNVL
jgi:hypothetical protein